MFIKKFTYFSAKKGILYVHGGGRGGSKNPFLRLSQNRHYREVEQTENFFFAQLVFSVKEPTYCKNGFRKYRINSRMSLTKAQICVNSRFGYIFL